MQATSTNAVTLAEFTTAKLILPNLHERTTVGVINELNEALAMNEGLPSHLFANAAAINHELLTSRRLDGGMVIAQVRMTNLPHTRFALGRAAEPLPWRAARLPPVSFVALVVEPVSKPSEYQRVVGAVNVLAHHAEALKAMREAGSAEEMLAILAGVAFHCR